MQLTGLQGVLTSTRCCPTAVCNAGSARACLSFRLLEHDKGSGHKGTLTHEVHCICQQGLDQLLRLAHACARTGDAHSHGSPYKQSPVCGAPCPDVFFTISRACLSAGEPCTCLCLHRVPQHSAVLVGITD